MGGCADAGFEAAEQSESLPIIGVVVPARNEARRLPRLLESLRAQAGVRLDVVVVVNGSNDGTASEARAQADSFVRFGHRLQVVELAGASKSAALNQGDRALAVFPRAYVDADVILARDSLAAIYDALNVDLPRLAGGRIALESGGGRLASMVATALQTLPPFSDDVVGGGLYALNASGRSRWGEFPDVIADDAFVVSHFAVQERVVVDRAWFLARFPATERLLPVLSRWEAGRLQLRSMGIAAPGAGRFKLFMAVLRQPRVWGAAIALLVMKIAARRMARSAGPVREWAGAEV